MSKEYAEKFSESLFVMMNGINRVRAAEVLDKMEMDALRARFEEDNKLEGRRLNREAHVDDRREASEVWERMQEP
jgi:hypothetical protein